MIEEPKKELLKEEIKRELRQEQQAKQGQICLLTIVTTAITIIVLYALWW